MNKAKQKTILFTGSSLPAEHREKLAKHGYEVKIERSDLSETELINALNGVSAYILGGNEKATAKVIEQAKALKIISFFGVGYETYIDAEAATKNGIAVTNTPGANARSVAEFAIALMLDAVKRTTFLIDATKKGDWKEVKSWDLLNKKIGIVGLGKIGSVVAKIAHEGFGMEVLYTSRSRKLNLEEPLKARFMELPELLKECDVLSLHANANEKTIGMIGKNELAMMKPTAVLVNCARAELVDPQALKEALLTKKIACAAFDGYYIEPAPEASSDPHGLLGLSHDMFLASPHTAYFTEDATQAMADAVVKSVMEILDGSSPSNLVNPEFANNLR